MTGAWNFQERRRARAGTVPLPISAQFLPQPVLGLPFDSSYSVLGLSHFRHVIIVM